MKPAALLLFQCVKKFPGWLGLSILLGLASAWISGLSMMMVPMFMIELIGLPLDKHATSGILRQLALTVDALPASDRNLWISVALTSVMGLKNLCLYASNAVFAQLTRHAQQNLRTLALDALFNADTSVLSKMKPGHLVTYIGGNVDKTSKVLVVACQLFLAAATLFTYAGILLLLSIPLTLATVTLFFLAFKMNHLIIRKSRDLGHLSIQENAILSSSLLDVFSGIRVVKSAAAEKRERDRLLATSQKCVDNTADAMTTNNAIVPLTEFAGFTAIICIVLLSNFLFPIQKDDGQSAVVLTFLFIVFRLLGPLGTVNTKRAELAGLFPAVESLATFLSRCTSSIVSGPTLFARLRGGLEFNQVSFKYQESSDFVLRDLTLSIPRGTTVALVGASGAGKSTIADLLCRFFDPTEGAIMVDGQNLRELDINSWRRKIGVVSQDPFLFNDSVEYNIRYARPDATEDEFIEAVKRSHCSEFIESLPLGLSSLVGERGASLSAGQRQRISIARALLTDPDILILDEATSALDSISESVVQSALDELMSERTTLVIAHRLATVRNATQIAVIDNGALVELGSHDALFADNGLYRRMCDIGSVTAEVATD